MTNDIFVPAVFIIICIVIGFPIMLCVTRQCCCPPEHEEQDEEQDQDEDVIVNMNMDNPITARTLESVSVEQMDDG
jgi:hypothetical protein